MISAAVVVGTINDNDTLEDVLDIDDPSDETEEFQDDIIGSRGTCSWLIFLSLVVFGVEGLWILLEHWTRESQDQDFFGHCKMRGERYYYNIMSVSYMYTFLFLAQDIVVGIILALGFFAGGICAAYYAAQWTTYVDDVQDAIDLFNALISTVGRSENTCSCYGDQHERVTHLAIEFGSCGRNNLKCITLALLKILVSTCRNSHQFHLATSAERLKHNHLGLYSAQYTRSYTPFPEIAPSTWDERY